MSIRQQIIDAIDSRLKTITTLNGYQTDIGNNVFEWRVTNLNDTEFPAITYRDVANIKAAGSIGSFRWALNIEIQIFTDGQTAAADIRKMLADVYKSIGTDPRWGGLAQNTEQPESDDMDIQHQEKRAAGALIKLSIIYDAPAWQI